MSQSPNFLSHPATGALCRLALGAVFIYAAVPKLLHPAEFARLMNGYRVIHPDLVNLVAITIPWVELITGGLLALGIVPQSAALVLGGLLVAFMGAGFLVVARGLEITCGCSFPFLGTGKLGWDFFARDLVMLLLAAQVVRWPSSFLPRSHRESS